MSWTLLSPAIVAAAVVVLAVLDRVRPYDRGVSTVLRNFRAESSQLRHTAVAS
jgi:hypothetical protein